MSEPGNPTGPTSPDGSGESAYAPDPDPAPHEGETPIDEQSETVSAPHRDPDPPIRSAATPAISWGLVALWTAIGVALVVVLILLLT